MPAAATVCGGIDALAHTIEILVGTANNEYTNQILFLCLNKIWRWLPVAVKEPENLEAREQMSWAAHNALANGGVPNGHALKDADAVANAIHVFCQELGLDTLQKIFAEKGYCDNCREFTEKMIPLVMDDFKSRE